MSSGSLRLEVRSVRLLPADSGARALDHRREGSGRREEETGGLHLGRAAPKIECPMLIGYSKDDRIMDPPGPCGSTKRP